MSNKQQNYTPGPADMVGVILAVLTVLHFLGH